MEDPDRKYTARKKMAARNPGARSFKDFARPFFAVFFHVTHDGRTERGTTRGQGGRGISRPFLILLPDSTRLR